MRVASPLVRSSGETSPCSGSQCGVSGIECDSPCSSSGKDGATSVGALLGSFSSDVDKGTFVWLTWELPFVTNCDDGMKLDITSTIIHLHPVGSLIGCSSGMKSNATRILRSQRRPAWPGSTLSACACPSLSEETKSSSDHNPKEACLS